MVVAASEEEVAEVAEVVAEEVAEVAIKGIMTLVHRKRLLNWVTLFIHVKMIWF